MVRANCGALNSCLACFGAPHELQGISSSTARLKGSRAAWLLMLAAHSPPSVTNWPRDALKVLGRLIDAVQS